MKKWMFLLGFIACWAVIYLTQPTKIVLIYPDISENSQMIFIVLENPPMTHNTRMNWWENNKSTILGSLKKPLDMKENWTVGIYKFGGGFKIFDPKEQELASYCFDNLPTKLNCINKEVVFIADYRGEKLSHSY